MADSADPPENVSVETMRDWAMNQWINKAVVDQHLQADRVPWDVEMQRDADRIEASGENLGDEPDDW